MGNSSVYATHDELEFRDLKGWLQWLNENQNWISNESIIVGNPTTIECPGCDYKVEAIGADVRPYVRLGIRFSEEYINEVARALQKYGAHEVDDVSTAEVYLETHPQDPNRLAVIGPNGIKVLEEERHFPNLEEALIAVAY